MRFEAAFLLYLIASLAITEAFVSNFPSCCRPSFLTAVKNKKKRGPSKVVDLDGPTPDLVEGEIETIYEDDVEELKYDENKHPIPHQPWRRGETYGCEDPIDADWRLTAECIMKNAARTVGGNIQDVTWYLTQVVVTLDEDTSGVEMYDTGPTIDLMDRFEAPQYFNEDGDEPEDIWPDDEPEFLWEKDTETEEELNKNKWAHKDDDDDDDEDDITMENDHAPLQATQETRAEIAGYSDEEEADLEMAPVEVAERDVVDVDTRAISTVAQAILDGLEQVEDDLNVLARHEIILTSPGASDVLETQRQFDAYKGFDVIVETVDPWESNRVLRGKLLERNSMDVLINKKGRMVTIPLNFVKCVRLPPAKREKEAPIDTPL